MKPTLIIFIPNWLALRAKYMGISPAPAIRPIFSWVGCIMMGKEDYGRRARFRDEVIYETTVTMQALKLLFLSIELGQNIQGNFQRIKLIIHRNISWTSIFNAIDKMLELQLERVIFVDKNSFDQ